MANVYVRSGAAGAATGADWANAYLTLNAALTAKAAGDTFWVSEDHNESTAATITHTSPGTFASPCFIYCVDHLGSVPPVSADLRTTGVIATSGSGSMNFTNGHNYVYGLTFNCGTGAASPKFTILSANNAAYWSFNSCKFAKLGTNANSAAITISALAVGVAGRVDWKNVTVQFGHTSDRIGVGNVAFKWTNTPSAIVGATLPGALFNAISTSASGSIFLEAVDLSALTGINPLVPNTDVAQRFFFKDCKFPTGLTVATLTGSYGNTEVTLLRSDSAAVSYRHEKYTTVGSQIVDIATIRTSGASDGVTGISWKLVTLANSKWFMPFEALPIAINNATTAANVTATIQGVWNAAALPNNDEIWFDLEYLGSGSNPQGSYISATKADGLATGTALTASTEAWDSLATARANSTAYSVGNIIKVATNPGRIFFCTTGGTTAGSEPAGYAAAVDGGSVTDNTATFRACMRFKVAVTASSPQPAMKGYVYAYVKAAKASSTFWIDPLVVLS